MASSDLLFNNLTFLAQFAPFFKFSVPSAKTATRTGCSNILSPTGTVYRGRSCWLFYCLPKWESPLHLSDAALHKVLLPGGHFALQLSEESCLCRLHPGRVTYAAPPHAAEGWCGSPEDIKKYLRGVGGGRGRKMLQLLKEDLRKTSWLIFLTEMSHKQPFFPTD